MATKAIDELRAAMFTADAGNPFAFKAVPFKDAERIITAQEQTIYDLKFLAELQAQHIAELEKRLSVYNSNELGDADALAAKFIDITEKLAAQEQRIADLEQVSRMCDAEIAKRQELDCQIFAQEQRIAEADAEIERLRMRIAVLTAEWGTVTQ